MALITSKSTKNTRLLSRLCIQSCVGAVLLSLYVINQHALPEIFSTEASFSSRANRVTSTPSPVANEGLSEYAKQVLLQAARERNELEKLAKQKSEISNTRQQTQIRATSKELPPLDSLIDIPTHTVKAANVQWLLDFAIVGFGKCGTTTLLQWLQQSPLVRAPSYEAQFVRNQAPTQLIRKMYQFTIEEKEAHETKSIGPNDKIIKGFKNPSDIRRPKSRELLAKYWPQTPLIVTVRHPVKWLVSIYNYFKIEKGRHKANVTVADMLTPGGRDENGDTKHFVSTAKGEFHSILAEVGKTPLKDTEEWKLLQPWLNPKETTVHAIHQQRLPNPIFFMEMQQLADSNTTRAQKFAKDLEVFLGLPQNHLPPALHVRPNTHRVKFKDTDHLKMDICAPEYAPVLQEMVAISRSASQWLRDYFIKSPDVKVSSPEYLRELLEDWMVDPCVSTSV